MYNTRPVIFVIVLFLVGMTVLGIEMPWAGKCKVGKQELRISLQPVSEYYCLGKPIKARIIFENLSDSDVLMVLPSSCGGCLFFTITDPSGRIIYAKVGDKSHAVFEDDIKLTVLKPKEEIVFEEDVLVQYYGLERYELVDEGKYSVTAKFIPPGIFVMKDGRESYSKTVKSGEINVVVKRCPE